MNNFFQILCDVSRTRIWLLLIALLLTGCSANRLAIRYFYGEIDNNLYDRTIAYATFSETQKADIKRWVDDYTRWHRHSELPRYAAFLDDIAGTILVNSITNQTILAYFEKAREFARTGFKRFPLTQSAKFLKELSDQQIDEIQTHFAKQDEEFLKRYKKRQEEGGNVHRLKSIVKNVRRIADIKLSAEQQEIIRQGLQEYKGDPQQRHDVFNRWQSEFIGLLQNRNQADFEQTISAHIAQYQDQVKFSNPQQYRYNQQTFAQILTQVIASLDIRQKEVLLNRLKQTRNTLLKIATG